MVVLDTNVVSEALKPAPSDAVKTWLRAQNVSDLFVTAVTQAEILFGVEALPSGNRKSRLAEAIRRVLAEFRSRTLPFDEASAHSYAKIAVQHRKLGRPISQSDAMIAAIALSNGAAIAMRDVAGFEHFGVKLLNPWQQSHGH